MNLERLPDDLRTLDRSAMLALLRAHRRTALTLDAIDVLAKTTPAPIADHLFTLLHLKLITRANRKLLITPRGSFAAELIARAIAFAAGLHHIVETADARHLTSECTCGAWSMRLPIWDARQRTRIAIRQHIAEATGQQADALANA